MNRLALVRCVFTACVFGVLCAAPGRADDEHNAEHGAAAKSAEAHAQPNVLEFKPKLAITTVLVFAALLAVLWKYAWGPLSKALDDRERYHAETLQKAEHTRAESERMLAEHRALMANANDDVRAILDEARRDAESLANDVMAKAQQEAEASRHRAERDIATARDQALAEIWTKTAELAVNVAGKVLEREIGPDEHRRLLDRAIGQLPSGSPNGEGARA